MADESRLAKLKKLFSKPKAFKTREEEQVYRQQYAQTKAEQEKLQHDKRIYELQEQARINAERKAREEALSRPEKFQRFTHGVVRNFAKVQVKAQKINRVATPILDEFLGPTPHKPQPYKKKQKPNQKKRTFGSDHSLFDDGERF